MPTASFFFFFFNDTATTEIYTLSLHDALPIYFAFCRSDISIADRCGADHPKNAVGSRASENAKANHHRDRTRHRQNTRRIHTIPAWPQLQCGTQDRKSTRLNSSHGYISYAVFCLKKKKTTI